MNNRRTWVGEARNRWLSNTGLVAALVLFGALFASELGQRLAG